MENMEDKFRALEIEDELQKLKQELRSPTSQTSKTPTTSQSDRCTPPINEKKIARFYAILGLKPDASTQEVKQAYRALVKRCHPDLFFHNPQLRQKAQEVLTKINEVYEELCANKDD
jgi:DnaJ-domain-containing protein 1